MGTGPKSEMADLLVKDADRRGTVRTMDVCCAHCYRWGTESAGGSGLPLHEKDWLILRVVASGQGSR